MATKYEITKALYEQTQQLVMQPEYWQRLLSTACRNYRLSFDEQLLLYAQKPGATAVLEMTAWNRRFGRWVNRGISGISVFDREAEGEKLKHYFDISDTHPSRNAREVPIWEMKPEYEDRVTEALILMLGKPLHADAGFAPTLIDAASTIAQDSVSEYLSDLLAHREGSTLANYSPEGVEMFFTRALQNSVAFMLLTRCGISQADYPYSEADFRDVAFFNTPETINRLGDAVRDLSARCLTVISKAIVAYERQAERNHAKELEEQNRVNYNEANKDVELANEERSTDNGRERNDAGGEWPEGRRERTDEGGERNPVYDDGRDLVAVLGGSPGESVTSSAGADELRSGTAEVPEGAQTGALHGSADNGQAGRPSEGDSGGSLRHGGSPDRGDGQERGRDGGAEEDESAEMGRHDEQPSPGSAGDRDERTDLQLNEQPDQQGAERKKPSAPSVISRVRDSGQLSLFDPDFSMLPDEAPAEPVPYGLRYSQQVIDEALCIGANDRDTRLIICAYLMKDKPLEDNARFLMRHYGVNGAGFYVDDRQYAIWYDAEGIRLSSGRSAQGKTAMRISWTDAAKRIRELLDLGRYMPQAELDRVQDFEYRRIAESLWHLRQDFGDRAREMELLPSISEIYGSRGGFPEDTAKIRKLLSQPESLQAIIDELRSFNTAYEADRGILSYHYHRPKELLQRLTDLQREPVIFTAAESYGPQHSQFISMDEIDKLLRSGSTHYRLGVYSYFLEHPDKKERARYLQSYHGNSGSYGGNDITDYGSKGLSFGHGDITAPYAKIDWSWAKAADRIEVLIRSGSFLSEEDRTAMPEYERRQLAIIIQGAFFDLPDSQPRPFSHNPIADYWENVAEIQAQLVDPAKVEEIYQMLVSVAEGTKPEDRYYASRQDALAAMESYREGTYSLFGERPEPKPTAPAQQEPETEEAETEEPVPFIQHFYVIPDLQVAGQLQVQTYPTFEQAYAAYALLPKDKLKALGVQNTKPLPGSLDFIQCRDGVDTLVEDYQAAEGWNNPEITQLVQAVQQQIRQTDKQAEQTPSTSNRVEEMIRQALIASELSEQTGQDVFAFEEGSLQPVNLPEPAEPVQSAVMEPPRQRRERVEFSVLHPEIPPEERHDFHITDRSLGYGTPTEKYNANVEAIRTLKKIESEKRLANPEEQAVLSRYVGWGGLADCFDERSSHYEELKALLSEDEYAAARASTLTAFYTSPVIIEAVYSALSQMGFQTGNILEPACGVGNFIGMLPDSMAGSKAYGVEIDSISGRIAQQLYQNSRIAVDGFEKVQMPDSFFDVAVGNVPFGDFKVLDKQYDKYHWLIHDYFFGKTLDKVRPGGIVAFITSKGTMDKENSAVRKYLAQRADLIGAIRLPDNAFKRNAGTEVTSDIIFLQKRDRVIDIEPDWVRLDTDENGIRMNSYFVQHPEMVLGNMVMESTRFGMDSTCKAEEDADLSGQLRSAVSNLQAKITSYEVDEAETEEEDRSVPADPSVRNFSYTLLDGKIYFRENSRMYPAEVSATAENRIRGMIAIRDCVRKIIELQLEDWPDETIQTEQDKLNKLYDDYTKKYGLLSARGNSLAFREDSSYALLCSLEETDEEGRFTGKADIFTKRTIRPHVPVERVDTASEALILSLSERAKVDLTYMSEVTGKAEKDLAKELTGVIFQNVSCAEDAALIPRAFVDLSRYPYVTADEYLSGNVRKKLRMVKALAEARPDLAERLQPNIAALEAVQPTDLTAGEIGVRIGANWIPREIYEQFMHETFETAGWARSRINVVRSDITGDWSVTNKTGYSGSIRSTTTYGTSRINAYQIFEQTLNQKDVRIFDTVRDLDGKEKRVLNRKETTLAQDRQEQIKSAFADWIWADLERREKLCKIYNETFNSIRPREYDGSHLTFPGMNPEIMLRKHQVDAIAHILYGGNTLLAHEVGAGKTYEMAAAAMESKRLGLCTKSLIVVPNHITEQWAAEWLRLYPSANILVATKRDFEPQNRKKFCARIATGDYDAIIIGHSQFEKIPMSVERQEMILQKQIDTMIDGIESAKQARAEHFTVKQLERTKKSLEAKLAKLNDQSRKDDVVTFEELGVDRIFIDESHYFKNLFLATKMRNVGGIAQTEAQKSSDLFMKCQYLDEITGGKGVVFATGTPISNSMVELYTIQRYLQYHMLEESGLIHFDDWAATFGETITAIELSPEGSGYRAKTRFAKFYNLPELMSIFRQCADVQTAEMLQLPVPKANFHTEVIEPSELQKETVAGLADRAEQIRAGGVDPKIDNMLRITNDGRKLALDMRLVNPLAGDDPNGKVSTCARNVFRIWEQTTEQRGAQLVFCDLSTPKDDGSFSVYNDMKKKLMDMGIPANEIAFIHDANTETRKQELFGKVRAGQIRVLLGSTSKMGAGTNVQDRLVALHDLDCPWRPSDLAQRLGRIVRQGNRNEEVDIYRYVTEGTFDAYLYQLVENKQRFIGQIMTGNPARAAEDIDETALSYSEIKALATGNPLILEKCNLEIEVAKLNALKSGYLNQKYDLERKIARDYPAQIAALEQMLDGHTADHHLARKHPKKADGFVGIELDGQMIADKKAAGKKLLGMCAEVTGSNPVSIGMYRGFRLNLYYDGFTRCYKLSLKGDLSHEISLGQDAVGNFTRMDNALDSLQEKIDQTAARLSDTKENLKKAEVEVTKPFAQQEELFAKSSRLKELNILLNLDQKDHELIDGEPETDTPELDHERGCER